MKVKKKKKGEYRQLTASALVVPKYDPERMNKPWTGMVLPEGSIIRVVKNEPSIITGLENEITVKCVDLVQREFTGWLARDTPMKDSVKKKLSRNIGELRLAAWDTVREKISFQAGWDAMTWIATFGHLNTPLLHAVIRELGGKVPKTDDPDTANVRVLRLILRKGDFHVGSKGVPQKRQDQQQEEQQEGQREEGQREEDQQEGQQEDCGCICRQDQRVQRQDHPPAREGKSSARGIEGLQELDHLQEGNDVRGIPQGRWRSQLSREGHRAQDGQASSREVVSPSHKGKHNAGEHGITTACACAMDCRNQVPADPLRGIVAACVAPQWT